MLTKTELSALEHGLRSTKVLSVFLAQAPSDPATHHGWRVGLEDAIRDVRTANTGASHEDAAALERAVARFETTLRDAGGISRQPGWVGYIGPDRTYLAQPLPVATPTAVSWGYGLRIGPLIQTAKETRPAIVAVVDSRRVQIYRYEGGQLERVDALHALAHTEPPTHMGAAPRQRYHSGTRGRTGTDQAQRERLAGRHRMMTALGERMVALAGADGWLLFGGAPVAVHEALAALPPGASARAHIVADLHLRATPTEITAAGAAGAHLLRRHQDLELVRSTLDATNSAGRGTAGLVPTLAALKEGRVHRLFLTSNFLQRFPDEAEPTIRAALDEGADIEVVSGEAAELLDAGIGGVAAALRYGTAAGAAGGGASKKGEQERGEHRVEPTTV